MRKIIGDEPCPSCREKGRDSTGNHLIIFSDGNKYCNRCGYFESENGVSPRSISKQEFTACYPENNTNDFKIRVIAGLSSLNAEERKISADTYSHFKVKSECNEANGEVIARYYPITANGKTIGYKKRELPKNFTTIGKTKGINIELFGQAVAQKGGKKLVITGGEEDACALWQVLKKKYPSWDHSIVSLPRGENTNSIKDNIKFIQSFEEVILALDTDETGKKATENIIKIIGPHVKVMDFTEKDLNDLLIAGKEKEMINQFFNAKPFKPIGIYKIQDIPDEAVEPTQWGLSYPFESLTKLTYGLRTKGVIGIGAGPGAGKTTFIQQIQKHLIYEHKEKIGLFSLEEDLNWSVKKLVGSIMRKPIHLPDCKYDLDEAKRIKHSLDDSVYLFDHNDYNNWEDILTAIRFFRSDGVKWFFIDPLSALVAHLDPSDANKFLNENMFKLEKLADSLDCTFFHVNHLNNPTSGKDHGAGGKVYGSQFSGSRAQWKYSTDLWGLERDQLAEDEEEKNVVTFSCIKNRLSGTTQTFKMKYNKNTGLLEELDFDL